MTVEEAKQIMMDTPIQIVRNGDTIKVSKEYPSGLTSGKWYSIEHTILENEDPIQELLSLERKLDQAFTLSQSNGVSEWKYAASEHFIQPPVGIQPIPTINRKYDEMKAVIEDCGTLEELAKHKEYCGKHPDLMPHYMNKLKSLTQ